MPGEAGTGGVGVPVGIQTSCFCAARPKQLCLSSVGADSKQPSEKREKGIWEKRGV